MKTKRPKGITLLAVITLLMAVSSINQLFNSHGHFILLDFILKGLSFKVYYFIVICLSVAISVGLLLMKKWSFLLLLFQQITFIALHCLNILFVEKQTLLITGWQNTDNIMSSYRAVMLTSIIISTFFLAWILLYRKHFITQGNDNA